MAVRGGRERQLPARAHQVLESRRLYLELHSFKLFLCLPFLFRPPLVPQGRMLWQWCASGKL